MSTTDNYEFHSSLEAQSEEKYSPYSDLQFNYINDSNGGVYQATNCMVQFDLANLYNASKYTDTNLMYLAIPITVVWGVSTGGSVIAPPGSSLQSLVSLKSNYVNLIHSCDLVLDGKTINQSNAFSNIYNHVKMLSQLTPSDLATMGTSLGFSSVLDNHRSMRYVASTANSTPGTGLCNNIAFSGNGGTASFDHYGVMSNAGVLTPVANRAIQERIFRVTNASSLSGIYGASGIVTASQIATDLRPYYVTQNNFGILYDIALIPLKYIYDSMANIKITKKINGVLKVYLNTGSVGITIATGTTTPAYQMSDLSNSTFVNTCPLTINYLANDLNFSGVTCYVQAGVYVRTVPTTSFNGINLAVAGASHPLTNCRLYYPQIELQIEEANKFNEVNRFKKVVHRQFTVNTYNGIASGASENRLVQAGIKNPVSVVIVPIIASTANFVEQYRSPFDTSPATFSPVQLSQLQCVVGGKNYLANQLNYSFDHFLQQINNHDSLGLSELGINQGLFTQEFWELNRVYFVDVARSSPADKNTPRSVQVNFTNNSNVTINYMVFVEYLEDLTIDTLTGAITLNNQM